MVAPFGRIAIVLLAVLVCPATSSAQILTIQTAGDSVKIRAQDFSFLRGDALARLKDGQSVRAELTAMVLPAAGQPEVAAARRIFALSYDLWEERFAVTTVEKRSRSMTHLTLPAAEAWCIDQIAIPLSAFGSLGRDRPFWIRLEYRVLDADTTSSSEESGFTLQTLIDLLSRVRKTDSAPHAIEAGPFRLKSDGASSLQ